MLWWIIGGCILVILVVFGIKTKGEEKDVKNQIQKLPSAWVDWKPSEYNVQNLLNNLPSSFPILVNLVDSFAAAHKYSAQKTEVLISTHAFMGLASTVPEAKINDFYFHLLNHVIAQGQQIYKGTLQQEAMALPAYLQMLGDWYSAYYPERFLIWHAFTNPSPVLENLNNLPFWKIAQQLWNMTESADLTELSKLKEANR